MYVFFVIVYNAIHNTTKVDRVFSSRRKADAYVSEIHHLSENRFNAYTIEAQEVL